MDWPILAVATFLITSTLSHLLSYVRAAFRFGWEATGARSISIPATVSTVRPVCGMENFIEETLRSAFALEHERYEIPFCAASLSDPIISLIERLIAAHPQLLIGNSEIGANPKLDNMVKGWDAARGHWIVIADSNVLMARDCIGRQFLPAARVLRDFLLPVLWPLGQTGNSFQWRGNTMRILASRQSA